MKVLLNMDEKKEKSRIQFFGKILPPSNGIQQETNDFTQKDIDKMRISMPLFRQHNLNHKIGDLYTLPGDGSLYSFGYIDRNSVLSDSIYEHDIKSSKLKELSLSHAVFAFMDNNKRCILKFPYEVSVVDKGNREGCFFVFSQEEEEEKENLTKMATQTATIPAATNQTTNATTIPVPAAATIATPAIPTTPNNTPTTIPTPMEEDPLSEKSINSAPAEELKKVVFLLKKTVEDQMKSINDANEYKKKVEEDKAKDEQRVKKELESYKQNIHNNLLAMKGKDEAEAFTELFQESMNGKTLEQLAKENRMFSSVSSNMSFFRSKIEENESKMKE